MNNCLLTFIFILFSICLNAEIYYVSPNTTGRGTSWEDANGDLVAVLFAANYGDEVWVAEGTYYTSYDNDRTRSFIISKGVKVLGGFSGNETNAFERNPIKNKVVLSGNIGDKNSAHDNAYTVVLIGSADENTVLDGFSIIDGTANSTGTTAKPSRSGAGLYVMGAGEANTAAPVIKNCIFYNNYARDGGAVYNNGRGGNASPTFENCKFYSNRADLDGGALFNDGRQNGISSPILINCDFQSNEGNYGGAICNYGSKGKANPQLNACTFSNNEAFLRGGCIFNMDIEGEAAPQLNDCQFMENAATAGAGVYTFSDSQSNQKTPQTTYAKE